MNIKDLIPKKPKQKRSVRRFENILDTVEEIILTEGIHSVTVQKVSKVSKMKRPTIYKLFPSNESLFFGLSERHINQFNQLYENNSEGVRIKDPDWYMNLFVDLLAIYLNQNKACARIFFFLDSLPKSSFVNDQNKRLIATIVINTFHQKDIKIEKDKLYIASQICLSTLAISFNEENCISPSYINEAKKAVKAYLSTA